MHVVEHGLEDRVCQPGPEDVQGLDEGHPGFEQRGQFLIEHEKFVAGDLGLALAERQARQSDAPGTERKDVEALVFQLAP
jgi:hypothetical protein